MSVHSKMAALADEIRELSGTSEAIGLDAMKAHVGEANDEVASQADLIAQIQTALEGKAAGGDSGSSGETINTCNITINSFKTIQCLSYTAYENNKVVVKLFTSGATTVEITNVICGSSISFCNFYDFNGFTHSHDSRVIGHYTAYMWALSAPTTPNINATISIYDDD